MEQPWHLAAMFKALIGRTGVIRTVRSTMPMSKCTVPPVAESGVFAEAEAIGSSRGGRTRKIHALTDAAHRPCVLLIASGHVLDAAMAPQPHWHATAAEWGFIPEGRVGTTTLDAFSRWEFNDFDPGDV